MAGEDNMARERRQRRRMVFGAALIAALCAGAVLIFFLDDLLMFDQTYSIHVLMPGAAGLVEDTPVWVSGREVGTVSTVAFLPVGRDTAASLLLTVLLPRHVQSQVRTDSEVRLTSVSFVSEPVVDIEAGTAAGAVLAPGDTLRLDARLTATELTARAAVVKSELDAALAELRSHAPAVRARLAQVDRAMTGLDAMVTELLKLQANVNASPGAALLQDPAFRASLDRTRAHTAALRTAIAELGRPEGAAAEVRAALARLQMRGDSLGARLDAARAALDNPNGSLARLQQDSALVRAIGAARAELDSLIADARRNPLRFVF